MVSTAILVQVAAAAALLSIVLTYFVLRLSDRGSRRLLTAEESTTQLTARLISVLATAGFVVDDSMTVIQSTNSALALGLVSGRNIDNEDVFRLVQQAHDSDVVVGRI